MKLIDICTHEPKFIRPDDFLMDAAQMMKLNRLVGIVSLGDLAVRTGQAGIAGEVLQRVCEPSPGMP